jgi:hypothetical protein
MGKMAPTQPITKAAQDGQFDPGFVIRLNQFLKQSSLAMEPLGTEERCQITTPVPRYYKHPPPPLTTSSFALFSRCLPSTTFPPFQLNPLHALVKLVQSFEELNFIFNSIQSYFRLNFPSPHPK